MICCDCLKTYPPNFTLFSLGALQKPPELFLCQSCEEKYTPLKKPQCPRCQRQQTHSKICQDCLLWKQVYPQKVKHQALFIYDEAFAHWMERFKFQKGYHLRFTFQDSLKNSFLGQKKYLLVPIPLSKKGLEKRGFNQVASFLSASGLPYTQLLEKSETTPQSHKKKKERMNLPQVFKVKKQPIPSDAKLILVDDVYTTGTTLVRGQQALEKAGYQVFKSFSLAR